MFSDAQYRESVQGLDKQATSELSDANVDPLYLSCVDLMVSTYGDICDKFDDIMVIDSSARSQPTARHDYIRSCMLGCVFRQRVRNLMAITMYEDAYCAGLRDNRLSGFVHSPRDIKAYSVTASLLCLSGLHYLLAPGVPPSSGVHVIDDRIAGAPYILGAVNAIPLRFRGLDWHFIPVDIASRAVVCGNYTVLEQAVVELELDHPRILERLLKRIIDSNCDFPSLDTVDCINRLIARILIRDVIRDDVLRTIHSWVFDVDRPFIRETLMSDSNVAAYFPRDDDAAIGQTVAQLRDTAIRL
jgi:hypothetical protein